MEKAGRDEDETILNLEDFSVINTRLRERSSKVARIALGRNSSKGSRAHLQSRLVQRVRILCRKSACHTENCKYADDLSKYCVLGTDTGCQRMPDSGEPTSENSRILPLRRQRLVRQRRPVPTPVHTSPQGKGECSEPSFSHTSPQVKEHTQIFPSNHTPARWSGGHKGLEERVL